METQRKTKKPVYKRVWFWLLLSPVMVVTLFVLTAIVIGIAGGFDDESNQQVVAETQPITQNEASTAMPTPLSTLTPTIALTNTQNPIATATPTVAPTKTPKPTPTPTQTPKPTTKPTPTLRPTPTPTPTLDPSKAPYGVDINGNPGPDFITLISVFEYWLEGFIGENVKISVFEEDWKISKANFGYVLTTKCRIPYKEYDVIMKIEFDETYETYEVFQLKINGINIDL